jgi:hypothetical protein
MSIEEASGQYASGLCKSLPEILFLFHYSQRFFLAYLHNECVTHYLSPVVAPHIFTSRLLLFATRLQSRASSKLEFQSCTRRQQPHRRQRAPMLVRTSWIWETCLHMTPPSSISSLTQATCLARLDIPKKSVYPAPFYTCRRNQLN